MIYMV